MKKVALLTLAILVQLPIGFFFMTSCIMATVGIVEAMAWVESIESVQASNLVSFVFVAWALISLIVNFGVTLHFYRKTLDKALDLLTTLLERWHILPISKEPAA